MFKTGVLFVVSLLPLSAGPLAGTVTWVDWTDQGPNTVTGTLGLSTPVNVTYSGAYAFANTAAGGPDYWSPNAPYLSGTVTNAPDSTGNTDIIGLGDQSTRTLTFSQPVSNLFFAVVSLNGNGYVFDHDFDVLSFGCGFWGCGTLAKTDLGGGNFRLDGVSGEPHGVIEFTGTVSSITWTTATAEFWNGFTVGVTDLAPAAAVPEPGTWTMMFAGVGLLAAGYRRRAARS